jgi:hypothetical protein
LAITYKYYRSTNPSFTTSLNILPSITWYV